ncbi:hypothetical protein GY45DRAFT_1107480 [Cubamyces sp. BRFM 1775]|nr:hypothetical protein GY45DRAFT_1107480 [Cubamyces sp. BRFM 1775]
MNHGSHSSLALFNSEAAVPRRSHLSRRATVKRGQPILTMRTAGVMIIRILSISAQYVVREYWVTTAIFTKAVLFAYPLLRFTQAIRFDRLTHLFLVLGWQYIA